MDTTRLKAEARSERDPVDALKRRVDEARPRAETERQAQRLIEERDGSEAEVSANSRQQRRAQTRASERLQERSLRLLARDDDAIRAALERRERIDEVMNGSSSGALDDLLWLVIHELKLTDALRAVAPPPTYVDPRTQRTVARRTMYAPIVLNLLSLMTRSLGLTSGPEMHAALLTDARWMALLGFGRNEVLLGSTRRSEERIGTTREGEGGPFEPSGPLGPARARPDGPRGALSSQTVAERESSLEAAALETLFNAVVRALAKHRISAQAGARVAR